MATIRGAVQLALAVKRGELKLAELSKATQKKVEFVIKSGSIDGMKGTEKTVKIPHERTAARLRVARA